MSAAAGASELGPPTSDGEVALERLRALPGAPELIELAASHGGVELIGGAVRDLLLGRRPKELDAVVHADVQGLATMLAERLGGQVTLHERFGTALVRSPRIDIDLASMRAERYPTPGALPEVRPGSPLEDLERRDFTVNAIALGLAGETAGQLRSLAGALDDLAARRLRVLHEQSFREDPTRIMRLVRYATRLGFSVEPHTGELAAAAIAAGALQTVSGERLGAELRLALCEPCAVDALVELQRLGVLAAWHPGVSLDEQIVRRALQILPADGFPPLLLAAALLGQLVDRLEYEDTESAMRGFVYDLALPTREGKDVFDAAIDTAYVVGHVDDGSNAANLLELTNRTPIESLALAAAIREHQDGPHSEGRLVIEQWLEEQRHIVPQISGEDLIAAGIPEGPEIGWRLREAYMLLLEQRIEPGHDSELRAALQASQ